jgi:hypothetical protein
MESQSRATVWLPIQTSNPLFRGDSNPFHRSRGPLVEILPLFPLRLQFPILVGLNLLLRYSDGCGGCNDRVALAVADDMAVDSESDTDIAMSELITNDGDWSPAFD